MITLTELVSFIRDAIQDSFYLCAGVTNDNAHKQQ